MLRVDELSIHYAGRPSVKDISFTVGKGAFFLISGPTGCGKSILALTGLILHASKASMRGRVLVERLDTREHLMSELTCWIGIVFQNPATQLYHSTMEEELALAPQTLCLPEAEVEELVAFALAATGIQNLCGRSLQALSAGERHWVAIVHAASARGFETGDARVSRPDEKASRRRPA